MPRNEWFTKARNLHILKNGCRAWEVSWRPSLKLLLKCKHIKLCFLFVFVLWLYVIRKLTSSDSSNFMLDKASTTIFSTLQNSAWWQILVSENGQRTLKKTWLLLWKSRENLVLTCSMSLPINAFRQFSFPKLGFIALFTSPWRIAKCISAQFLLAFFSLPPLLSSWHNQISSRIPYCSHLECLHSGLFQFQSAWFFVLKWFWHLSCGTQ